MLRKKSNCSLAGLEPTTFRLQKKYMLFNDLPGHHLDLNCEHYSGNLNPSGKVGQLPHEPSLVALPP